MLEPTHIIRVPGFSPPASKDILPDCKSSLFYIRAVCESGYITTPAEFSEKEAVANWNRIFSKAPYQPEVK